MSAGRDTFGQALYGNAPDEALTKPETLLTTQKKAPLREERRYFQSTATRVPHPAALETDAP